MFTPAQILHLSHSLLNAIEPLKSFVRLVKNDKKMLILGAAPSSIMVPNPFESLDSFFEVDEAAIVKGAALEKEFHVPLANAVHVTTLSDADLPPPASNEILLIDAKSDTQVWVISRDYPAVNKVFQCEKLKITAKIVNELQKDVAYSGCCIRLRPKV